MDDDSIHHLIMHILWEKWDQNAIIESMYWPKNCHFLQKITLVSILSMQSRTKSGWPERISSSDDGSYSWTLASTMHSGNIAAKCFCKQMAFGVPTSSLLATAWRFNDDSDTFWHEDEISFIFQIHRERSSYLDWKKQNIQVIVAML